jgi:cytochrome c oxidase cbb3-type subunit 3
MGEPRQPGPHAPSQELKNPTQADEASLKQGEALYKQYCVTCHALDGSGATDMTETLTVPPATFRDAEWKYGATDGEIFSVIRDGGQNGMQGFTGKMPELRMWHVVNYLRTLSKQGGATVASEAPENPIATSPDSIALGKQLYVKFCVVCHGANGRGDTEMREFLPTHPSDLTDSEWKYGARDGDIFVVIKNGTEYDMEAFADRLTDERIWHVVNYLRSFGAKGE